MPYRQNQWRTDITVGDHHLGLAAKWEGAKKDSETSSYPTAEGDVPLGGKATRDDGTATYLYNERIHAIAKKLDDGAGSLDATITRTPHGDDGTPMAGGGYTMTGKLKSVELPEGDAGSSDGAEIKFEFNIDPVLA